MSGGIVQLVATGAQDAWLTGKPEVSFFRSNYRRYTHYAQSVERQVIQGTPQAGGISMVRFEKKGDLLSYVYLSSRDSNNASVAGLDWSKIIDKVELLIGGQVVDTQDFQWMSDVEPVVGAQTYSQRYLNLAPSGPTNQKSTFFPLKLFFCKDFFLALPLVALQFHDVELRITWSSQLSSTVTFGATTNPSLSAVPQATINVASTAVTAVGSNVAYLAYNSVNGPLFTGSLVTTSTVPDANTLAIVKQVGNVTSASNVTLSFANTATISNVLPAANSTLNVFAPVTTALVVANTVITSTSTSATLTINPVNSPVFGSGIQPGQYVAGLPLTGPVVVSSSNATSVTVTFGAQVNVPPTATIAGTQLGFFTGTANTTTTYASLTFACWANFIYLDQAERKFFAENTHDLLIHQVNRVPIGSNPVQELSLAQPVKYIAWQSQRYDNVFQNGNNSQSASSYMLKTQINGVDVGEFRHLPQWVDVPQYYNTPFGYVHQNAQANVAIISYCLDTSKSQPTGTINFSRLDTYRIVTPVTLTDALGRTGPLALTNPNVASPYFYAVNYNVLRIQNGLGSVLYAN
jgi:Major capsid protein N-terminus/Large eukaryotic DNA virus major capsid protein